MQRKLDDTNARCKGIDVDLFYLDDENLRKLGASLLKVRTICFRCPIRKECMEYGFKYERYGMFGGISAEERDLLRKKDFNHVKIRKLLKDLAYLEISINEILPASKIKTEFFL